MTEGTDNDGDGRFNEDPTGGAWFFKIKVSDMSQLDEYMSEDEYQDMIARVELSSMKPG